MKNDFVVPNLSGAQIPEMREGNVMLNILNRLNESVEEEEVKKENESCTCPKCGIEFDGKECPQCGTVVNEEGEDPDKVEDNQVTESFHRGKKSGKARAKKRRMHEAEGEGVQPDEVKDPEVAEEKKITESAKKRCMHEDEENPGVQPDEVKDPEVAEEKKVNESTRYRLVNTLVEYYSLCEAEEFDKAKELIADEEVAVKIEPDGAYIIEETDGEDEDPAKVKLTEEELEDLKKVTDKNESFRRKSGHRINESKRPKKAMKARARKSITESYRKTRIVNAVQKLAMQEGISFSGKKLQRVINEAYRINEAEIEAPEDKIETALEQAFSDVGVAVKDCDTETNDGVLTAHLTLEESDAEVYLGDIADTVEEEIDGFDVDYDEPEVNEADDSEVYVDFHFVPVITTEAEEDDEVEDEESVTESEDDDTDEDPKEDDVTECDSKPKKVNEKKSFKSGKKKINEEDEDPKEDDDSIKVNENKNVFESFAGGSNNVRCKINPAFIKPNQVIFDADSSTVFQAMTESVHAADGYGLGIEVFNSANPKLAGLVPGAEVTLSSKGNYYLLKNNPTK